MARETGQKATSLIARLLEEPKGFSFYGAVHLLEASEEGAVPVGYLGPPAKECVRLRPSVSMAFPEADLEGAELVDRDGKGFTRLTTTFLGLCGVTSPVPLFYPEEILQDVLDAPEGVEPATRAFLDIVHHRLLSLLYRCWKKYRYLYQRDPQGRDPVTGHLFCLVGLDPAAGKEGADTGRYLRLLPLAGLITQQPKSAAGLEAFLRGLLPTIPLSVDQCTPCWMEIPGEQRSRLGTCMARLGVETVAGKRVLGAETHFTLRLGPLEQEEFQDLLPGGRGFRTVVELGRFFVGPSLEFSLELVLKKERARPLALGRPGAGGRLGWDAWLLSGPPERDLKVSLKTSTQKENDRC